MVVYLSNQLLVCLQILLLPCGALRSSDIDSDCMFYSVITWFLELDALKSFHTIRQDARFICLEISFTAPGIKLDSLP